MTGDLVLRVIADTNKAVGQLSALTRSVTRLAAAYVSLNSIQRVSMMAEEFNQQMNNALAIIPKVSAETRKMMEAGVLAAARQSRFSAAEAAQALYQLHSAGFDASQAMKLLSPSLQLAQAGAMDAGDAVRIMGTVLTTLGLKSKDATQTMQNAVRVSDMLTVAVSKSNMTMPELGEAIGNAAQAAAGFSQTADSMIAVLATFHDLGIRGAESGTRYRMVVQQLSDSALKHAEAWRQLGVSVYDVQGTMRALPDIIRDMARAMEGMSDAERQAVLMGLGIEKRVAPAITGLIQRVDELAEKWKQVLESQGATADVAKRQITPWQQTMSDLNATLTELGEFTLPAVTEAVKLAVDALKLLKEIAGETEDYLQTPPPVIPGRTRPAWYNVPGWIGWIWGEGEYYPGGRAGQRQLKWLQSEEYRQLVEKTQVWLRADIARHSRLPTVVSLQESGLISPTRSGMGGALWGAWERINTPGRRAQVAAQDMLAAQQQAMREAKEAAREWREAHKEQFARAAELRRLYMTPAERAAERLVELQKLREIGALDTVTYVRALRSLRAELSPEHGPLGRFAGATLYGGPGAYQAVLQAIRTRTQSQAAADKRTADNTAKLVQRIDRLLEMVGELEDKVKVE